MAQVILNVPEISCAQCERTIARTLQARPGIDAVSVDLAARQVHLAYDPAAIDLATVASLLDAAGYPVVSSVAAPGAVEQEAPALAAEEHAHAPGDPYCAFCDREGTTAARPAARIRSVKVRARGEDFRIVQMQGNLFVCSKAHGSCCCGWTEKGRLPVNVGLYEGEWERRKIRNRLHLTFTGCLGPCAVGNNAMLQVLGRSIWFKDLNDDRLIPRVFDYAEAMLQAGQLLPPPEALREHVYERYLPPPEDRYDLPIGAGEDGDSADLERLDPVCLMDVDPATASYKLEHDGRMFYFCAPACKKAFERDPAAYLLA